MHLLDVFVHFMGLINFDASLGRICPLHGIVKISVHLLDVSIH